MRVLLYNWVPYDDLERRGGGVRVYQANLVRQLVDQGHRVDTVSSGLEHDRLDPSVRVERHANDSAGRVRSHRLVNSPVMAPGHHCFGSDRLFDTGEALSCWHDFLAREGPWDVVQFDSLEGIPFTFLRVHEILPDARVLLYAHNYYAVCPQVNLWKNEATACQDYRGGRDCVDCLPDPVDQGEVMRAHQLSRILRSAGVTPRTTGYHAAYAAYARLKHHDRALSTVTRTVVGGLAVAQRVRSAVGPVVSDIGAAARSLVGRSPDDEPSEDASTDASTDAHPGPCGGSPDRAPSAGDGPERVVGRGGATTARTAPGPRPSTRASTNGRVPGSGHATTNGRRIPSSTDRGIRDRGDVLRDTLPLADPLHRSEPFRRRRVDGTALINSQVDVVLATSSRTRDVLAERGIDPDRIRVCRIGSRSAEVATRAPRRTSLRTPGIVTVAYLGYMRRDKGFHHLLDALERAADDDRRRLRLVVAARAEDAAAFERLRALADHTAGVWHHDGYDHDQLEQILAPADVGLVPVQWEDNLPQVAMEMMAHGLPLLTSHRGGASELGGDNPAWTVPAEDHEALVARLVDIARGELSLASYWSRALPPRGMAEHLDDLLAVYRGADDGQSRSAMNVR